MSVEEFVMKLSRPKMTWIEFQKGLCRIGLIHLGNDRKLGIYKAEFK